MDLTKLAESLGLPKESTEAVVFQALAKRDAEGRAAVESLSTLAGELPKHGFKLEAGKLVAPPPPPVRLDLAAKDEDDEEKKSLKAALRAAEEKSLATSVSSNKEFVTGLAGKLGMPPAMMSLAEEILGVRGELEAVCLSKDGKVEIKKTSDFPKKLRSFMEQLSAFPGMKLGKTKTEEPKAEEELAREERKKLAKEVAASVGGGK